MKPVPCGWVGARLALLAGGDLLGQERRSVERHIRECAQCRARLSDHKSTLALLELAAQHSPVESNRGSLWLALQTQIRESRREPVLRLSGRSPSLSRRLAFAAALFLVLSGMSYGLWRYIPYRLVVKPPTFSLRRLPRPVIHPPISRMNQADAADETDGLIAESGEDLSAEDDSLVSGPAPPVLGDSRVSSDSTN